MTCHSSFKVWLGGQLKDTYLHSRLPSICVVENSGVFFSHAQTFYNSIPSPPPQRKENSFVLEERERVRERSFERRWNDMFTV